MKTQVGMEYWKQYSYEVLLVKLLKDINPSQKQPNPPHGREGNGVPAGGAQVPQAVLWGHKVFLTLIN